MTDGQGATVDTPWGRASELKKRRLHPGSGTPREEVVRNQREALLRVADELCAELGYAGGEDQLPCYPLAGDGGRKLGLLSPDDEALVAAIRRGLATVAAAAGAARLEGIPQRAVCAALNGAEMVMRGELVRGHAEQLPSLMPSFVFLVTLPIVEQGEALDLARRTAELIETALRS